MRNNNTWLWILLIVFVMGMKNRNEEAEAQDKQREPVYVPHTEEWTRNGLRIIIEDDGKGHRSYRAVSAAEPTIVETNGVWAVEFAQE